MELSLLAILSREADPWTLEEPQRIMRAKSYKEHANDLFRASRTGDALRVYGHALDCCRMLEVYHSVISSGAQFPIREKKEGNISLGPPEPLCDEEESKENYCNEELLKVMASIHLNMAICASREEDYLRAFEESELSLRLDPTCLKTWLRHGTAAIELGKYAEAEKSLTAGLERFPDDTGLLQTLKRLKKALRKQGNIEKKMYGGLFKSKS
eukprot:TRINITY_DN154486_c0_g2_i1.p1 TRINITY_DN154486_c0_g2~~TRINITY_DN154486_c0_g2_i1.p1  ORF type:complete len:212 (-),score=27.59 TRINITY_DN154486_c0_g2_i1:31-666(-)